MQKTTTRLALTLSLALAALPFAPFQTTGQETPGWPPEEKPARKLNWKERQQDELAEEIEGTWLLMSYSTPNEVEDPQNFRGWAMFRDGYLSWMVYGVIPGQGIFGTREDVSLEALAFRYRIGPNLDLQLATMLGFSNLNDTGELEFDDGRTAFDYRVTIDKGFLTLRDVGVETLRFRKLGKTEFPKKALRALQLGGDTDIFDEDF